MNKSESFLIELNSKVKENYKNIFNAIADKSLNIISFEFETILEDDLLKKYNLNNNIRFIVDDDKMKYYYKNIEIKPDCYYSRPNDYHEVSILRMLQECIIQDKSDPDIKYLERGEELPEILRRTKLESL
ncbi:hypothetical protein M0Q50_08500 [bacterium]|jgi:hypothetical protein|nr:hypothetical protein [bacterium]